MGKIVISVLTTQTRFIRSVSILKKILILKNLNFQVFFWRNKFSNLDDNYIYIKESLQSCKRNFKWPFIQRWHRPIYNGTLETFIWSNIVDDIVVFLNRKGFYSDNFSIVSYKQEMRKSNFQTPQMKINSSQRRV